MRLAVIEACKEVGGADAGHLVTRETGRAVRGVIAKRLEAIPAGAVLTLDFGGVGIVDFSCADECLAKLVTRLIAGEFGDRYLRLTGLGESQRENVQVALERKRLPGLLVNPDATWDCLGTLTPHLRETLRVVTDQGRISARALAGLLGIELTTSSTRLGALHRQRLVSRTERTIDEGGREFIYEALAGRAADRAGEGPGA